MGSKSASNLLLQRAQDLLVDAVVPLLPTEQEPDVHQQAVRTDVAPERDLRAVLVDRLELPAPPAHEITPGVTLLDLLR